MQIRTKTINSSPEFFDLLKRNYKDYCDCNGRKYISLNIPDFPKSANHMYLHTSRGIILKKEIAEFRNLVFYSVRSQKIDFKPSGVISAVILLEHPLWITKKRTIRDMDADNRIKPLFDALQYSLNFSDEIIWNHHVFKLASNKKNIEINLFDLGDIVEFKL